MKKACLILLIIITTIMNGCNSSNKSSTTSNMADSKVSATSNMTDSKVSTTSNVKDNKGTTIFSTEKYTIEKAVYKNKDIQINYPQISNLGNSENQKKINEIIKTEAISYLDDYKDAIKDLNFNLDFEIKYKGTDFLSIVYLGLAHVKDTAYPVNIIFTSNIDLAKAETVVLAQIADSADEEFANKLKNGKYKPYSSDLDLKASGVLKQVLDGYDSHTLMLILKPHTTKFYLTKDSLGVSIEAEHAIGDHFEMEVDYKALGGLLSIKPKGSEDIITDKN